MTVQSFFLHKDSQGTSETLSVEVSKDGGYFLDFEYEKKESPDVPPMNIRIPSSVMEQELINAGFTITKSSR